MDESDIISNFDALKKTMKHQFPNGAWSKPQGDMQLGRFTVTFKGQSKPEIMTVFHTGATLFQGSSSNGQNLKAFFESLSVSNLLEMACDNFKEGTRLHALDAERTYCYQQQLPNATALLMKAILEDLWKAAFGDTGFDKERMNAAIEGSDDFSSREIALFTQIRGYGNGASHAKAWSADMNDIISVQAKYEQLVSALVKCRISSSH